MTDRSAPPTLVRRAWYRPMVGRRVDEAHRAATPLELFFDLCFVVAVAQASAQLHHDLTEGHIGHGVVRYLMVFFAIWWAWMNFTWFASAYDNDDLPYRLATLVQIAGALIIAAGIPRAFVGGEFGLVTLGYVVMRLALVTQWLRAARDDPARRPAAVRFAIGVGLVQLGWIARLAVPETPPALYLGSFPVLVVFELLVPIWAERAAPTTWHPRHIAERYGLFTIIVLGESVLAASIAMQAALDANRGDVGLVSLAIAGIVIVFAMWWLYFDQPAYDLLTSLRVSVVWGYGHYVVFAAAAAVGAGLALGVDYKTHAAHLSGMAAGFAVALPVALYLLSVWALQVRPRQRGLMVAAYPVAAGLLLLTPFTRVPIHLIAAVLVALVAFTVMAGRQPHPV